MNSWASESIFYHLYPLGSCEAPFENPRTGPPESRILLLKDWIPHARRLGCNALYLGPVWESTSHGYDTTDYTVPDRRLGTVENLIEVVQTWKSAGFKVVLDAVFHHCGREFAPFVDLRKNGDASQYRSWFSGIDFARSNTYGDPFSYDGWNGHDSLVKFNLKNPEVCEFFFSIVSGWMEIYGIDGLRLDAADVIDKDFLRALCSFCRSKNPNFWLLGEVIHGDYRQWAPGAGLDAVTNYEAYKGLWSSFNDKNFFEIAWSLTRQFGSSGLYRDLNLYNFADNHDVNRVASTLENPAHLWPLHLLLWTIPGIPSLYYGSEAGVLGKKAAHHDRDLRPSLQPSDIISLPHPELTDFIARLSSIRKTEQSLRTGNYEEALVKSQQFGFWRVTSLSRPVLCLVNASEKAEEFTIAVQKYSSSLTWIDLLNPEERFEVNDGKLHVTVWPSYGRILAPV